MKALTTWILIADGARARILERVGHGEVVHPVFGERYETDLPPSRELGDDRPGRVHESMGHERHAIEPRRDPHRGLEVMFAHQLADILTSRRRDGLFDRLMLAAPPAMLGHLRRALSKDLKACLVAEVDKDLTKSPNHEIIRHMEAAERRSA